MRKWKITGKRWHRLTQVVLLLSVITCAATGCGSGEDHTKSAEQTAMPAVTKGPTPVPTPKPTPEKTKMYKADKFTLEIPQSWADQYQTKESGGDGNGEAVYLDFYANKCHEETGMGLLFSIGTYKDESYKQLSSYVVVGKTKKVSYVAVFPIKLQTVGASEEAKQQYDHMFGVIEKVANSLELRKKD
ncbi:MAG: hypothetical protein HFG32_07675 [Eubacterium sp.]|jgi:hypothetical protein|nr:hypothetical protein [Eubacterium sp.]